jgi:hypothetical protein
MLQNIALRFLKYVNVVKNYEILRVGSKKENKKQKSGTNKNFIWVLE